PATIRVDAIDAELERIDIARVDANEFPQARARELLAALDGIDDDLARARGRRAAYAAPLALLRGMIPTVPESNRPPPRLDATAWPAPLRLGRAYGDRLQSEMRALDRTIAELERKRETLVAEANQLGGSRRQSGHRVVALVSAHRPAVVRLSYFV